MTKQHFRTPQYFNTFLSILTKKTSKVFGKTNKCFSLCLKLNILLNLIHLSYY